MQFAIDTLLVIAVLSAALSAAGVLAARDFYERLQYLAPVASIGIVSAAVAVLLREGFNQAGIKALLIAGIGIVANSAITHATVRAGHAREEARRINGDKVRSAGR